MKRRTKYKGLKKHISEERRARLNHAWGKLTRWQRAVIFIKAIWHSTPTLHQIINHIKFFGLRWFDRKLYPAHWVR